MKKYRALIKASLMEILAFPLSTIATFFGNIVFFIFTYYLWHGIYNYSNSDVVSGLTCNDTIIYLALANVINVLLDASIIYHMEHDIRTGKIIINVLRPLDFQLITFFYASGYYIRGFVLFLLPTFLLIPLFTKTTILLGINCLYFLISLIFSILISFFIDFIVGTICIFTQSTWGINIMKQVIVSFLSGAVLPLTFFPEKLRIIVEFLPFQAMFHIPISILTNSSLLFDDIIKMLGCQVLWIVITFVISKRFWKFSSRYIAINGG